MSTVAERIKIVRDSLGESQKDMAKTIGISLPALQGYEAGKSFPGGKVLLSLAKLGFNSNWLLTGEGQMHRNAASQSISGHGNFQIGGSVGGDVTSNSKFKNTPELIDILDLLEKYGNRRIIDELKEKLLKIKAIMEDE